MAPGHRGAEGQFTGEAKRTTDGTSQQQDIGDNAFGAGRTKCDIRLRITSNRELLWATREVGTSTWNVLNAGSGYDGKPYPGDLPFSGDGVLVGLTGYAYSSVPTPFVAHCDALVMIGEVAAEDEGDSQSSLITTAQTSSIAAAQNRDDGTQSVSLRSVAQLALNQSKPGDFQSATISLITSMASNQVHLGDSSLASIVGTLTSAIGVNQSSEGDVQSATFELLALLSAAQSELADAQNTSFVADFGPRAIGANQIDSDENQSADLQSLISLSANQAELGETQLSVIVEELAQQTPTRRKQIISAIARTLTIH